MLTEEACICRPGSPVRLLTSLRKKPIMDLALYAIYRITTFCIVVYEQRRTHIVRILTVLVAIRGISRGGIILGDQMSNPVRFVFLIPRMSRICDAEGLDSVRRSALV